MMTARYKKYILEFKQASGTSRGILKTKETYFLFITRGKAMGIGESAVFRGLSYDDVPNYEEQLQWVCDHIDKGLNFLWAANAEFPSIQFALEQAFLSLESKDSFELLPSAFTNRQMPIPINGLIWMGEKQFMKDQISKKLDEGFTTIKLKIGAIDFEHELSLLQYIRNEFSSEEITIRVDANGAFKPVDALEKLKRLSDYDLHSIEQPIRQNQWNDMAVLCEKTPLPIALDEELIGVITIKDKEALLEYIKPQFIILKPSLVGGIKGSDEWISTANTLGIGWWITSALESNIGLNAIAQYTYTLDSKLPQGLGTGQLFTNNITSPLVVENGTLIYDTSKKWNLDTLDL